MAWMMIENKMGVENIEEILSVPGVSGVFIGEYDLSHSLGLAGNMADPEVEEHVQRVLKACIKHDVPCGLHVHPDNVEKRFEEGFKFVSTVIDAGRRSKEAYEVFDIVKKLYR